MGNTVKNLTAIVKHQTPVCTCRYGEEMRLGGRNNTKIKRER
jgi:hypothetical protein